MHFDSGELMVVLGIETSCDETAAAILKDGKLLANVIADQTELHSRYGGVVPELAGRAHTEKISPVIQEALDEAGLNICAVDVVAVTQGPGLVSSLLVGLNAAKALAYALKKPLIGVNHLEGHLLAIFLQETVPFPYISLGVSGGHTDLYRVDDFGAYTHLGRTRDDAAGESFDKVARMMGWGYPGGPIIENNARQGDPKAHPFPRAYLEPGSLDFSFSGLKTSVRTLLEKKKQGKVELSDADIAASFQAAVVDVLLKKLFDAAEREVVSRVIVTGGVAANGALRAAVKTEAERRNMRAYFPEPVFCTDNAAMIACVAYHRYLKESREIIVDPCRLDAFANLPLGEGLAPSVK